MNEEQKSLWKKPWRGRARICGWFATLWAATFVVFFCLNLALKLNETASAAAISSLIISSSLSLAGILTILFFRWVSCWRNFRRFLFGIACFVTLIALFYAVENWRGKRAWDKYRKELEAKGETLNIANLAPRPIPDDKNFALTPLLKPALDITQSAETNVWHDTNGYSRLIKTTADQRTDSTEGNIALGSVEKGTLADIAGWQKFYDGNTNYPQPTHSVTAAQAVLIALSRFDPEISELLQAASNRPWTRFPVAYGYEPSYQILLPHLAPVKLLTILTDVRATAELAAGQSDRAFEELKLGFRFSGAIKDEPLLISHLVRLATLTIDVQVVREGLARHTWTEGQLVDLERELASIDLLAEYEKAMRGERAFGVTAVDYMRRRGRIGEAGLSEVKLSPVIPSGWFYQNMLTMAQMHEEFTLAAVDAQVHRVFPDVAAQMAKAMDQLAARRYHPYSFFAAMLLPALSKVPAKSAHTQTFVDGAEVACALERHRLAKGNVPETLSALVPEFIDSIPTDVIDGQPLRYRLTGDDGYILYSIGWNKSDDGGELAWSGKSEKNVNIYEGDWVWFSASK